MRIFDLPFLIVEVFGFNLGDRKTIHFQVDIIKEWGKGLNTFKYKVRHKKKTSILNCNVSVNPSQAPGSIGLSFLLTLESVVPRQLEASGPAKTCRV